MRVCGPKLFGAETTKAPASIGAHSKPQLRCRSKRAGSNGASGRRCKWLRSKWPGPGRYLRAGNWCFVTMWWPRVAQPLRPIRRSGGRKAGQYGRSPIGSRSLLARRAKDPYYLAASKGPWPMLLRRIAKCSCYEF